MTKESEIPVAAKLITEYLEYYSQKNYGSGWELNIEYLIWHKLISQDVEFPKSGRFWNWHGVDIIQLRKLAAECKGWVCFNHSAYAYATDDYISVFIPMDKWLKQYEEYAGRAMTNEQQQRFDKAFLLDWLAYAVDNLGYRSLEKIICQKPTAELRPGQEQTDETDLMPYNILDAIETWAILEKKSPQEVLDCLCLEFDKFARDKAISYVKKFFTLWAKNQWKRSKMAPSMHCDSLVL